MAWRMASRATSPRGQRVEYWESPGNGYSVAEAPARVVVSGRTVVRGWNCDGATYGAYDVAIREGWVFDPPE